MRPSWRRRRRRTELAERERELEAKYGEKMAELRKQAEELDGIADGMDATVRMLDDLAKEYEGYGLNVQQEQDMAERRARLSRNVGRKVDRIKAAVKLLAADQPDGPDGGAGPDGPGE